VLLLVLPTLPRLVDILQLRLPLRTSLVVREAVSRAAEDPRIIAQLGQPIETHWNIAGYQRTNESGWSEGRVWIPISGPRGDATLYARAGRGSGLWVFTTLEFRPAGGESIDLLARRDASMTDLSPRGRVYLIHAGFPATIDLHPFRDYYRQTLGLDVTVLPSIDIADDAFDRARGQLVAESVVASMRRSLPVSPEDPEAIVLGVVEQDMYIAELNWNYAFSFRADDRFALVSTARMVPSFQVLWPRHDLVRSRLRKMLNKNIGILVYRLPLNDDPTSVMYGNVDSVGDLDNMQERFEGLGRQAVVSPTVVTHHSSALEPEIGTTTPPDPVDATYPCFLVSPVFDTNGSTPVTSVGDRCTPGMHTDRRFDEVEINLRSRLLVTRHTDFLRPDSMPLVLTRAHHAWDRQSRAFGIGGNHPTTSCRSAAEALTPTSTSSWLMVQLSITTASPRDRLRGCRIRTPRANHIPGLTLQVERQWMDLRLADGGLFVFPENYAGVRPNQGAPLGMQDAAGHRITFERDQDRNLKRLTSPSGHFLTFAYDDGYRIRRVTDDDGHAVQYDYDAGGRLAVVNDGARRLRYLYDGTLLTNVTTDAGQSLLVVKYQDGQVVELSVGSRRFRFSPAFDQRDDKMPSRMEITDERGDVRSVDVAQPH
jgi:YD repeat-containing protein